MERNRGTEREIEIDVVALFRELVSKLGMILLSTGIVAVASLTVSMFFLEPVYESTTSVYILNKQQESGVTYNDLQTATQLTSDYEELIKSRYVMDTVIADLKLGIQPDELADAVKVSSPTGTRILEISVRNGDPYLAQRMADCIREVSGKQIIEIMNIDAVNLVDSADLPLSPISPDVKRNTLICALVGFLLSSVVVVLMYLLNDSIRTSSDIETYLELSVLAVIPLSEESGGKKRKAKTRT